VKDDEITEGFVARRPVDALFGPDGCLYMLDYGLTWGANADSKLVKISYLRGNLPPVIKLQANTTSGREPLTVQFDSAGTYKREGGELRYQWRVQEQGAVVSTDSKLSHTFEKPGNYKVQLTASDAKGGSDSKTVTVVVGNSVPEVEFESPKDGDFFTSGKPIAYKVRVKDFEDGTSEKSGDAMGLKVGLEARWLKSADDKPAVNPGLALMKQSDCFNCHQVEQKLVGPALVDVAARYRGVSGAFEATIQRVRNGSAGVWSEVPMLPHQQHTSDEIAQMVSWIYSLEPGKTGASLQKGLAGEVKAPTDGALKIGVLEASYLDNGRGDAAPLLGKTLVRLRTRRIEAEGNETPNGCKPVGAKGASGGKAIGSVNDGHSLVFKNIPLHDVGGLTCRVASGGAGGKIELHAGSKDGPTLAEIEVNPTGGWDTWVEFKSPVNAPASGETRTDVVAVFRNPSKTGLMNLDWIQFDAPVKR
jgi:cytochrome c